MSAQSQSKMGRAAGEVDRLAAVPLEGLDVRREWTIGCNELDLGTWGDESKFLAGFDLWRRGRAEQQPMKDGRAAAEHRTTDLRD